MLHTYRWILTTFSTPTFQPFGHACGPLISAWAPSFCRLQGRRKSTTSICACTWSSMSLSVFFPGSFVALKIIFYPCMQPSHKTFKIKKTLAKKAKQNRQIPQWIRMRTDNKIRWLYGLSYWFCCWFSHECFMSFHDSCRVVSILVYFMFFSCIF